MKKDQVVKAAPIIEQYKTIVRSIHHISYSGDFYVYIHQEDDNPIWFSGTDDKLRSALVKSLTTRRNRIKEKLLEMGVEFDHEGV